MAATKVDIRPGTYYDSVVLMQLQRALADLPGLLDAGVVMGTAANKDLLAQSDLLPAEAEVAKADDLLVVVKAEDGLTAQAALGQVDDLLSRRRSGTQIDQDYLPQSLEAAVQMLPEANWVLISVPGRYAAGVARDALRLGKHVFLYSDNVSLEDEIELKHAAADKGLLLMGPDCGTAIVGGAGLGFANRVRRGAIGLVGASGTGLQQVTSRIHQLGGGISHALGTGGRDLSEAVGAVTARQGLDLLGRDPGTTVIALISKPPAPKVADDLLRLARKAGKPVVIDFIGYRPGQYVHNQNGVHFATTLEETAELAVKLLDGPARPARDQVDPVLARFAPGQRYLRGLFSGGTLAYEALLILQDYLPAVYSNAPLDKTFALPNALVSQEHTIVDLGDDELTVGRLHPMIDNNLRLQRLQQEADDPAVATILLDVVLGYGAHPDPAGELAPAIAEARDRAAKAGRYLDVVAVVVGTDDDPQNMGDQIQKLKEAGAGVETSNLAAIQAVGARLQALNAAFGLPQVDPKVLQQPLVAINVGLESFTASLAAQDTKVLQVNWRPPAGGDERLMGILARMKGG
jgi:FdrA protein